MNTPQEKRRSSSLAWAALFTAASLAAGALGGRVNAAPRNKVWYRMIRKSELTPPPVVFATVWPALYALGAWSAWRVSRAAPSRARTAALALWGTQLAANAMWTPTFFGAHQPRAAGAVLAANAASLAAYAFMARKVDAPAAAAVVPNLAWLGFASVLNSAVVSKNARGPTRFLTAG